MLSDIPFFSPTPYICSKGSLCLQVFPLLMVLFLVLLTPHNPLHSNTAECHTMRICKQGYSYSFFPLPSMHHSSPMKMSVHYTEQNVTKSQKNRTLPSRYKIHVYKNGLFWLENHYSVIVSMLYKIEPFALHYTANLAELKILFLRTMLVPNNTILPNVLWIYYYTKPKYYLYQTWKRRRRTDFKNATALSKWSG